VTDPVSYYEEVGGGAAFRRLVDLFYEGVEQDPVLRPMYPEEDLGPARHRMSTFLAQYWGGPRVYGDERGHPRLRLRHSGFPIDDEARSRWLAHMRSALDCWDVSDEQREQMWTYLDRAATTLVNR
jgi:hemoglobin